MTSPIPTNVEIRRTAAGEVQPIRFTWEGAILDITSHGRHWSDQEGDHWLVMADQPERVFTLHRSPDLKWTVSTGSGRRALV
jgi:hypothetical protein